MQLLTVSVLFEVVFVFANKDYRMLRPLDISRANYIGQHSEISFYDAKMINMIYCGGTYYYITQHTFNIVIIMTYLFLDRARLCISVHAYNNVCNKNGQYFMCVCARQVCELTGKKPMRILR